MIAWLGTLARLSAILAGLLMTFITLLTCGSIIGRETVGQTIAGDFEISGLATGAAIALFMPLCQYTRGHIIVDFFTAKASAFSVAIMDRLGALMMSVVFVLLTWRTWLGGLNAYTTQSSSMMMGLPEWHVYAIMVPAFALTALIALAQALRGFDTEEPA
ncbi:MAG: TRAP transporter small permease [Alphaproteobacteria bacterium]|nr:TRAP transporter small permease [Alphaproteobacteria bacterium]